MPCVRCPHLRISADGNIAYTGKKFVSEVGSRASQVAPASVLLLEQALKLAAFDQLNSSYATSADGCKGVATDNPGFRITVRRGVKDKSVYYYFGCRGLAQARQIIWLADTIDLIANSDAWVAPK